MTSKRMLLFPPGGPYRANYPTIVQTVLNGGTAQVFGSNTTIGNLLLFLMTRRQFAATAPNDGGTWTTIQTGQFQWQGGTDENGIGAYARLVTAAQTSYSTTDGSGRAPTTSAMYEIANAGVGGITSLLVSDHASGTAIDLGSLGLLDTGRLAFILAGEGADGVAETVTPGVWVRDTFKDRDITASSDSISSAGAFPQTWIGHTVGAGIAVQARVDISVAQKYGGIAVSLA